MRPLQVVKFEKKSSKHEQGVKSCLRLLVIQYFNRPTISNYFFKGNSLANLFTSVYLLKLTVQAYSG